MKAKDICTLETATISKSENVRTAVRIMEQRNVGTLVVVEQSEYAKIPVGIITDRDIALKACALDILPSSLAVRDIMSVFPMTVHGDDIIYDILGKMRENTIRRVPVVDSEGFLMGILSIDDILSFLVEEMNDVITIFNKEQEQLWF